MAVQINRIYRWSLMQTEKSQPEGKRIMPETRFSEFPALSVDPRVGIFRSHQRPMSDYFSYLLYNKIVLFPKSFCNLRRLTANFGVFRYGALVPFANN